MALGLFCLGLFCLVSWDYFVWDCFIWEYFAIWDCFVRDCFVWDCFVWFLGTILSGTVLSGFLGLFCLGLFYLGIFCYLGLFCPGLFCLGLFCLFTAGCLFNPVITCSKNYKLNVQKRNVVLEPKLVVDQPYWLKTSGSICISYEKIVKKVTRFLFFVERTKQHSEQTTNSSFCIFVSIVSKKKPSPSELNSFLIAMKRNG